MSQASTQLSGYGVMEYPEESAWASWTVFAGIMMFLLGAWHVLMGLLAIFDDPYFNAPERSLLADANFTLWGWVHLVAGVVLAAAGVAVFTGRMWARVVGTAAAVASALICFGFLNAQPFWATIIIALDVMIILTLTAHGSEAKDLV